MKNLKKTLAVVLAFAMVLSMGFSAFAYTDVTAGTKVAEAVSILSNLGIFTGFEDGTFKPNDTVTRAQMAAIICRTLGYEDQAAASTGTTNFYDVPASHWASGYINVAESLQIVNGYGNGAFGPEDQVTYEQAIKMIVVALGYELDAQTKGGWSTGYLAVASREGISKGANGVVGSPAVRGTIAVLVYNSLEVRLMDQESWTNDGDGDHFARQNATILSKHLEIQKWEGIVEATPYTEQANKVYDADVEDRFSLDTTASFYKEWANDKLEAYGYGSGKGTPDYAPTTIKCEGIDVNAFLGKKVVAYIGDDAVTGVKKLYAISEKPGVNSVMTIGLDQLNESGDKYYTTDGVIGYSPVGSTRSTDIALDTAVTVVKNFDVPSSTVAGASYDTADLVGAVGTAGSVSFIDNDGDGKIDYISAIAIDNEAVVKNVATEDGIITLETYVNSGINEDIDTEDDKNLIIVYKDGVLADVNAIAANDTISSATISSDDSFLIYYVSSKTVTGAVEGFDLDSETVTIAGEDYKLSSGSVASYRGKEGIFFLNTAGKIAYADADVAAGNYGLVIFAGNSAAAKPVPEIEVVLADGTSAFYPLSSKAEIVDGNGTVQDINSDTVVDDNDKTDDAVRDYLRTQLGLSSSSTSVAASTILANQANLIYKVKVVNGYVKQLTQVGASGTGAATDEYKAELNKYGSVKFGDSTVIFSVEATGATEVTADKIKVGTVTDFFVDGERSGVIAGYDKTSGTVGAVIGFNLTETVSQENAAVIITSAKAISYNDDDAVRVYGVQAGKEVSFIFYDEDTNYTASMFTKGDVILVGAADTEGVVANYTSLLKRTITRDSAGAITGDAYALSSTVLGLTNGTGAVKEDTTYHFGKLAEVSNKTEFNADKDTFYVNAASKTALEMEKGANYTLVDFTDGMDPEISRKSAGTGIFGGSSDQYESAAFVRIYDDEIVEVVVYRWTNAYGNGGVLSVSNASKAVTK